ncbi:MAG: hypothetical protein O3B84_04235, partial [Chloroflexi bacterium]|nr:hypothetical protein [Chloroflexota bacterium]
LVGVSNDLEREKAHAAALSSRVDLLASELALLRSTRDRRALLLGVAALAMSGSAMIGVVWIAI